MLIDMCALLADRQRQLLYAKRELLLLRSEEIIEEHQQLVDHLGDDDLVSFTAIRRTHLIENDDLRLRAA